MCTLEKKVRIQLEKELTELKGLGRIEKAVSKDVVSALCNFAEQDQEFARAILEQPTKNLGGCLKAVAAGSPRVLSDCEAYSRAAKYYFDCARVECTMTILMNPYEDVPRVAKINLLDVL